MKRRYSLKQKVWEYVRRQRSFRVGEMMMIFGLKKSYAQWFVWWLKRQGYIRENYHEGRLEDHVYLRTKEMPPVAPSSTTQDAESRARRRRIVAAKKAARKVLEQCDPCDIRAIAAMENVKPHWLIHALREMEQEGELALVGEMVSKEVIRKDVCEKKQQRSKK